MATIWLHRLPVAETARAETITWPSLGSWPLGETIRSRGREGWCDKTTSGRSLIVWKAHRIHPTEGASLTSSMLNKYPSLPLDELKHWWSGNLGECSNMRAGMSNVTITSYSKLWDVITYTCLRYLILATKSSYNNWIQMNGMIILFSFKCNWMHYRARFLELYTIYIWTLKVSKVHVHHSFLLQIWERALYCGCGKSVTTQGVKHKSNSLKYLECYIENLLSVQSYTRFGLFQCV